THTTCTHYPYTTLFRSRSARHRVKDSHGTFGKEGSLRRRSPDQEGGGGARAERQAADQDVVAPLDHHPRLRRAHDRGAQRQTARSEEHTSELQSLRHFV